MIERLGDLKLNCTLFQRQGLDTMSPEQLADDIRDELGLDFTIDIDQETLALFGDGAEENREAIQQIINSYVYRPKIDPVEELKQQVEGASTVAEVKVALLNVLDHIGESA